MLKNENTLYTILIKSFYQCILCDEKKGMLTLNLLKTGIKFKKNTINDLKKKKKTI